jgi:glycosyltransferase involved in cell wall biosynthesis
MKRTILSLCIIIYCYSSLNASCIPSNYREYTEKPIVVVIPSYNNSKWCNWNLSSVFQQRYSNYRVIYIDDCSTDNTYALVIEKIKQAQLEQPDVTNHIQVIRNAANQGALANIYTACHLADDDEIIVTLDGDDALAHPDVLSIINYAYQDPNVWLTYGQYTEYPEGWLGICHAIPDLIIANNAYRSYEWVTSHVRTYYAWLFKRVKKEDFMHENLFYPTTADLAIMFPLLEMSGGRFAFIDQILYIHNQANPLNDFKLYRAKQAHFEQVIRNASRYQPLLPIIKSTTLR